MSGSPQFRLARRAALLAAGGALSAMRPARAQLVSRNVRILVGFAPGGQIDAAARLLAEALRGTYAPSVVVENRPGASGRLALEVARTAEPDGTTLVLTPSDQLVFFGQLYGNRLRYDPLGDFTPVAKLSEYYMGFAAGPATPAKTLGEFVAWAKDRPSVPFGIPGPGTLPHFLGIQLGKIAGLPLQAVAYRGDGPAVQDVIAGQIPMSVSAFASLMPLVGSTPLRVMAVGMSQRLPGLPDVPTVVEAGMPDLALGGWQALLVPSRTPASLVAALDAAVAQAVTQPAMREGILRLGLVPGHEGAAALPARLRREQEQWRPIVEASGFRPED
ncbi:Tripartite-type tricarboxylate transporter, receptor component TctC [Roseomonas rosea]|uniref:Tripartite-type tricarboxylate transporter, receptor component TctC n=1 Tax=Muricoccus roseus TaxID=198092 RepID=A0A1M6PSM6_9PROT|nr:tripartite tricarboxylate transporter substrate-binding protein [Roseomonas rosea]SHK10910.1 Tripartite-type tricarboxylate transporter, receptor component TctC [Roseomonas rosea]